MRVASSQLHALASEAEPEEAKIRRRKYGGSGAGTIQLKEKQEPGALMEFTLECGEEGDGRWLAEVPQLLGVLAYGETRDEALSKAQILALRVIAERLEAIHAPPHSIRIFLQVR